MQRMPNQLDADDDGARAVMQQIFAGSIRLKPDVSRRYLIAVLSAGG
jgi:hypothetical protein